MAYTDILAHFDNTERSADRVAVAVAVASRFGARLRGLFAECDPYLANLASLKPEQMYSDAAGRLEAQFKDTAQGAGITVEWNSAMVRRDSALARSVIQAASYSDLAVLGQYDPGAQETGVPIDFVEQVLIHSGRPALVVPFIGEFPTIGQRVMIAWNGGREATRAVHDALPFLVAAESVSIVAVNVFDEDDGAGSDPCARFADHLAAHGVTARTAQLVPEEVGAMDMLLSRCADEGTDLLVMGAHGHYGFPHMLRGSATRHILRHMTVPVLMSH